MTAVPDPPVDSTANTGPTIDDAPLTVVALPIALVRASSKNPRRRFDDDGLAELAESIRQHGIIEPLVCRFGNPADGADTYDLIAGERRLRAAKLAGLTHVPVRLLTVSEQDAMRLRLVENLQRVDLDPIDEARGYRALHDELGMTQAEIAKAVGRSQPSIANAMRVLDLPDDVMERIRAGELTRGHGVALAKFRAFPGVASALGRLAAEQRWTVKACEDALREHTEQWYVTDALRGAGLTRDITDYRRLADRAVCNLCPFNAHFGHWCLRPEHYDELEAAAGAEAKAELAATLARAEAAGAPIAKAEDLPRQSYEMLWSPMPVGCTEACPCRAQALDYDDRPHAICTDPKRLRGLKAAAEKAEKKARGDEYAAARRAVAQHFDALGEITARELAVLAVEALRRVGKPTVVKEAQRLAGAPLEIAGTSAYDLPKHLAELAELESINLVKFAVEAVLQQELSDRYTGYADATPLAHWYLGVGKGKVL